MTLDEDLAAAVRAAPELVTAPSLALPAALSGDPVGTAEAVGHVGNTHARTRAYREHHPDVIHASLHWLGGAFGSVAHAGGAVLNPVLHVASVPLREIQHQYRYLHDVESKHGPLAALLESLGIAAGAAVGSFGGPEGTLLGAEAAAGLLARFTYRDSWERTESGYKDHGRSVSLGRDVASLLGLKEHSRPFTVLSGVTDGLADLTLDPLALIGKARAGALSAEGAGGLLASRWGGTAVARADDVERIHNQYLSVKIAFAQMAKMDAGEVAVNYPKFMSLARELGAAKTADEVGQVFKEAAAVEEYTGMRMPSMTFTRLPFNAAMKGIRATPMLDRAFRPLELIPSAKRFLPTDKDTLVNLYKTLRMGESSKVASSVVSEYANTLDPAKRILIYKNAVAKMIFTRAKMEMPELDEAIYKDVYSKVEDLTKGAAAGREAQYGLDMDGRNLSKLVDPTAGTTPSAGITQNQVGAVWFPNYIAVKRATQELKGGVTLFGKADDFLSARFTDPIFKRWVLQSLGFPLRVASGELIPTALRVGAGRLAKASITARAAKIGVDALEEGEAGKIGELVRWLATKSKIAHPDDIDVITDNALMHGGSTVAEEVSAEHHVSAELVGPAEKARWDMRRARQSVPAGKKLGDDFATFGRGDEGYTYAWQKWLHEVAEDTPSQAAAGEYMAGLREGASEVEASQRGAQAATKWLNEQPEEYLANYDRHFLSSNPDVAPHDDWGRVIMENVKGATHSAEGVANDSLLRAVSEGTRVTEADLVAIEGVDRPGLVKGREWLPDTSSSLERLSSFGFRKVMNPIVNFMAREPIYNEALLTEYKAFKPLVEAGQMDRAMAISLANERAIKQMTPFIHNLNERSQFAQTARNWMPFYFAQEQAYKRVGRLLAEDPGAFRRYQLAFSSLRNSGAILEDGDGHGHLVIPGTGWLDEHVPAALKLVGINVLGSVPAAFTGDLRSLKTVSPFLEGGQDEGFGVGPFRAHLGPVVTIPAHLIEAWMPESVRHVAGPVLEGAVGQQALSGSIWEQLIPNSTVRRVVEAFGDEHRPAFQTAMVQVVQSLAYDDERNPKVREWREARLRGEEVGEFPGNIPPPDASAIDKQKFVDRTKNQTRILYLMKAIVGYVSPLSPQFKIGDTNLSDEVRELIKEKGDLSLGIDEFLKRNPDATPYTVFGSENLSGAGLPASRQAEAWMHLHGDLIHEFPLAAAWFLPQSKDATFDQGVFNAQVAQGQRVRKSPKEFTRDLYVAAGNHQFFEFDKPAYDKLLASAVADGDADKVQLLKSQWSGYVKTYGAQNPVWYDWFTSEDRRHQREQAVTQMEKMFDSGRVPDGGHTEDLRGILDDWHSYQARVVAGRQDSWSAQERDDLANQWDDYLDHLSREKPNLKPVITSVFRPL